MNGISVLIQLARQRLGLSDLRIPCRLSLGNGISLIPSLVTVMRRFEPRDAGIDTLPIETDEVCQLRRRKSLNSRAFQLINCWFES
jgi:hypothetical protein